MRLVPAMLCVLALATACTDTGQPPSAPADGKPQATERVSLTAQMRSALQVAGMAEPPADAFLLARAEGPALAELLGVESDGTACTVNLHDSTSAGWSCRPSDAAARQLEFQQASAQGAPGWGFFAVTAPSGTAKVRLEAAGTPPVEASTGRTWRERTYAVGYWPKAARLTTITALDAAGQVVERRPATAAK